MIYVCRKVLITRKAKHCKHKTIQILVVAGATLFNEMVNTLQLKAEKRVALIVEGDRNPGK